MGGGGSSITKDIYHDVYVQADPQLLAKLKQMKQRTQSLNSNISSLENDLKKAEEQSKRLQDPRLYDKFREEAFDRFVDNIDKISFTKPIRKNSSDQRHYIVIGNISCGKSSWLNKVFGLKQKVALGECTPGIKKVITFNNINIWDSPGVNQHFQIYNPEVLSFFHCADRIFILYPDSLKSCSQIVKVLAKIKPKQTYLIRTQCDNWNEKMHKTVKQQLETDVQTIKKWKISLPVYSTSSKRNLNQFDNKIVSDLMKTKN